MPNIWVRVHHGTRHSVAYYIDADIYQDIIDTILSYGIEPGDIHDLRGNIINPNSPVILHTINYIIPAKPNQWHISIADLDGHLFDVYVSGLGTIRDIYDRILVQGATPNGHLVYEGLALNLDTPIISQLRDNNHLKYIK